jgi:hypothetical protein
MLSLLVAPALRAEYVVLRSGQRLTVTGYQLVGDKYRLQMNGGFVEIPSAEVVAIERWHKIPNSANSSSPPQRVSMSTPT